MDRGKATTTLSSATVNIIYDTRGVLSPSKMINFLKKVRGRKKAMDIARYFTSNIPALVKQLKNIEKTYFNLGKKGLKLDKDIDFIRKLYKRLDSISDDRCGNNNDCSFEKYHNESSDEERSPEGVGKKQVFASTSVCKATTTLCTGTLKIISDTRGVLCPSEMRKLLNQVRGKKKAMEIARCFTSNIPAVVKQLKNIEANYYKQGIKCNRMEKDIDFIRRLYKRLDNSNVRCVNNDDCFCEEYHNEDSYHSRSSDRGRKKQVFASPLVSKKKSTAAAKMQPSGRRKVRLSSVTIKIISNTRGPLDSNQLCQFLKEVRGKKKATEIARDFTENIPALINQLQEVVTDYSRLGRKGVRMKNDFDFIRRLRMRLQEDRNKDYATEGFSTETVSIQDIKDEYSTDEISSEESASWSSVLSSSGSSSIGYSESASSRD